MPGGRTSAEVVEVTVGRIGRPHGLRGEVAVELRTDEPERRFDVGARVASASGDLTVAAVRWHSGRLLVRFAEVPDRSAAELLRGRELTMLVPATERPDDPEEYYDHQLRGLAVYRVGEDTAFGSVTDVVHLPVSDLLVLDVSGREVLLPFVSELVPTVDLAAGRVEVDDRPGLLS